MRHTERADGSPDTQKAPLMQRTITRDLTISLVLAVLIPSALLYGLTYWFVSRNARAERPRRLASAMVKILSGMSAIVFSSVSQPSQPCDS